MSEERTIQIWPSGRSVTYRGDVWDNEHFQTRTRPDGGWEIPDAGTWADIRREIAAERILRHEIYCCDSSLVEDLLHAYPDGRTDADDSLQKAFNWDDVRNLYPNPSEWTMEQCQEWLDGHGVSWEPDDSRDTLDSLVCDHVEPAEVMEWLRVSKWLCVKLNDIGEVTIDNGYGCWWGRTCTGQAMIMDGTLQRVAQELE